MAKVKFQVDGLDANQGSIFNNNVTFDKNIDVNSITIAGNPLSDTYATHAYVSEALGSVSIDLSTSAGAGIDWNVTTSQFDLANTIPSSYVQTSAPTSPENGDIWIDTDGSVTLPGLYSAPTLGSTQIPSGNTVSTVVGLTLESTSLTKNTSIQQILEKTTVSSTAVTGTIVYDVLTNNSITYYSSSATGNWVLNLRGNGSTSINSMMSIGQALTISILVTQGSTAYYPTGFQVDGTTIVPKWQGGTAPSSGNASSIDSYSYSVIKTADASYVVFASQIKFA